MIKTSLRDNKKAIVGIGTLIVFIAMILVAAVAAGVLIRTSGVLQERAYAVGGEARKRLVTGLEVLQVFGETEEVDHIGYIPNVEIFVRTRPGSPAIQMQTVGMTYSSQKFAYSAVLQHSQTEMFDDEVTGYVDNETEMELPMDLDQDEVIDYVIIAYDNTTNESVLQFQISDISEYVNVSLGVDLTDSGSDKNISLEEVPIRYEEIDYGYIDLEMNVPAATVDQALNFTNATVFNIRQFPATNPCNFNVLIPERFYCFEARLGNKDTVLDPGELFVIRYKMRLENSPVADEEFQISFLPKDGAVTDLEAKVPTVVNEPKLMIWPY